MPSRRAFLSGLAPAILTRAADPQRPNLIVFMTDDHGAWASSPYGCPDLHTPNLQALSDTGARFARAYAATPVCSPSRMTYMTGVLPSRHTVQDYLRPEDTAGPQARRWLEGLTTYPSLLARAGYRCGMTGKWHMGQDEKPQEGFTYWATVPGGGGTFKNATFVHNGATVTKSGFKEDAIGDFALDFFESQNQQPFFLLVPFYAPHTPYDFQPDADRAPYQDSKFPCYPRADQHPWANRGLRAHFRNEASMRSYSALITGMDRNIGRILQYLEKSGKRKDTTVVFTADQGWNAGHHGFWGKGNGTWPFNMYEESIRVPLIWNHPGRIRAGQTLTPMVSSYDFAHTILDWTQVTPLGPAKERPGKSYAGFLRGRKPKWTNELYFEYSMVRAIRTSNSKLILRTSEWPSEFYDLEADPGEQQNKVEDPAYAKPRAALETRLRDFFTRAGAPPLEHWRDNVKQNLTVYTR